MRTVEAEDGTRYLLLEESRDASLVLEPDTGERRHLPTESLRPVEGESPLVAAAGTVPESVRDDLPPLPDDRAVGLLVEIEANGPVPVRDLLSYDVCESDLHGLLAELTAAGLLREARVGGERGYETTAEAAARLDVTRD